MKKKMYPLEIVTFSLFCQICCGGTYMYKRQAIPTKFGQPKELFTDVLGPPLGEHDFRRASVTMDGADEGVLMARDRTDPIELAKQFQGDIIVSSLEEYILLYKNGSGIGGLRNAIVDQSRKWPGGVVPYVISAQFDETQRALVARAVGFFEEVSCIRFVPRTTHYDYIHFIKGSGCSSSVGRVGGAQALSLSDPCLFHGIILHELLHSVGFWHEHSRYDRDNYIQIIWSNIQTGMDSNFYKYEWDRIQDLGYDYDLGSIMHYGPYAFAKDRSKPTIIPRFKSDIGQRTALSQKDLGKLLTLYECPIATPPTSGPCVDMSDLCPLWAVDGECNVNPLWMKENCRKSCKNCKVSPPCMDRNRHCSIWSRDGECEKNPRYMFSNCEKSCGRC